MTVAVPQKRFVRTGFTRGAALWVGAMPAAMCGAVAGVIAHEAPWSGQPVAVGCWTVAACLFVMAGARFLRLAIVMSPQRLTVRNFWTTRHIPWPQIEAIESPRPLTGKHVAPYGRTGTGVRITLCGGRVIRANAYARRTGDPDDFADSVVRELRRAVKTARHHSPPA